MQSEVKPSDAPGQPRLWTTKPDGWTRGECIEWLKWNDRNGDYDDDDSGLPPMTLEQARALVADQSAEYGR